MVATKECLFCKIIRGEISSSTVYQDEEIFAFRDINPQAPTHILIVPKRHIGSISDLTEEHSPLLARLVLSAGQIARKAGIKESGYRLVFNCGRDAGQAVEHIHLHLLGGRGLGWPPG